MRPIYFYILIFLAAPALLPAQDPFAAALRYTVWPDAGVTEDGFTWSLISRQYYSISNWNATGISAGMAIGAGHSSVIILRDGIPGYSWNHLYLSHFQQFKKFSGMLQLRFSMIRLKEIKPVLRLGGNLNFSWSINQMLDLQVNIFDFPGWILTSTAIRGDPVMEFLLFYEPGRLIGLMSGFQINQLQFGPITSGIRINIDDQFGITGLINALPFGVTLGICWKVKGFKVRGWLEQRNGLGITPTIQIGGY